MMASMDLQDTSDVISVLTEAAGADETWHVETFTMYRESPKHGHQKVQIDILDGGPDTSLRYLVSAKTPEGQRCSGNPRDDLEEAILLVHWSDLDK